MTKTKATPEKLIGTLAMFPDNILVSLLYEINISPVVMFPDETNPTGHRLLDVSDETNARIAIKSKLDYMRITCKNVHQVFWNVTKPNRLQILDFTLRIYDYPKKEYSDLLLDLWLSTEFPHQHKISSLVNMFSIADIAEMMDEGEKNIYANFPEKLTIYRGTPDKKAKIRGLSWTTDLEKAEWFAKRFNLKGTVYQATISKNRIFLYTHKRCENEVIVNPRYLKNVTEIKNGV
jgi:hypothetical protein